MEHYGHGELMILDNLGQSNTTKISSPIQIPGTNWDYSKIFYQNYAEADTAIGIKQIS